MTNQKYLDGLENPKEEKIYKTLPYEVKVVDDTKRTLVVAISTPNVDRSGDTMNMKGVQYDSYLNNPVVLEYHEYQKDPIATCDSLNIRNDAIIATVKFPEEGKYPRSDEMYNMYKDKLLNAWSIGFKPLDFEYNETGGYDFKSWELFEFSAVCVPDNPSALTILRSKGINVDLFLEKKTDEVIGKGAIGYKETPKAPKDEAWDGSAEVKVATVDDLKAMCAWVDSENADNKSAYKLPHHKAEGDHAVVWNGVKAAGGAVQGARNKLDVPEGDLAGIKKHLASHYREFDETPPWEKDEDGKAVDEENIETEDGLNKEEKESDAKGDPDKKVKEESTKEESIGEDTTTKEVLLTDLTVEKFMSRLKEEMLAVKEVDGSAKKDVGEVIALGNVLDCLSWFIWVFENNEMNQGDIDKLNQALGLVLQVVQSQAELGKKSFNIAEFPNTKETVKLLAKAGRTISAKNKEALETACVHMGQAVDHVKSVIATSENQDSDQDNDGDKNDGKSADDFLTKLSESLKNNNKQVQAISKKQNETNDFLGQILNEITQKGGEK